jgi:hypothetical protein
VGSDGSNPNDIFHEAEVFRTSANTANQQQRERKIKHARAERDPFIVCLAFAGQEAVRHDCQRAGEWYQDDGS